MQSRLVFPQVVTGKSDFTRVFLIIFSITALPVTLLRIQKAA
jgi:hypothetical protein